MSSKMLSREEKLRFVQEYVKHKCLVDLNKNETKSRKLTRKKALLALSKSMNIPGFGPKEAYTKVRNLRSTYAQELKKIKNASTSGSKYVSNLVWFETLDVALKAFNNVDCKENYTYMVSSEGNSNQTNEINSTNSLFNESNPDLSIKVEIYDEEENCVDDEKEIIADVDLNSFFKKEVVYEEPPTETVVQSAISGTCENCEGMSSDQLMQLKNEFDLFGVSIAAQLKNMPITHALEAQMYIQNYLSNLRLQLVRRRNL